MKRIPTTADLIKLKKPQISGLCKQFGINNTGSKPELATRITDHLKFINTLKLPIDIVSIDVGYVNLGYTHLKVNKTDVELLDWGLLNPQMPVEHNIKKCAVQAQKIVDFVYKPRALYCIERQSLRSLGFNKSVPFTIIRNAVFEALLVGMILERGSPTSKVDSVLPGAVSTHFGISTNKYSDKKKAGVALVQSWLNEKNKFGFDSRFQSMFLESKKQDDLSDSLMLGIAYSDWIRASKEYISEI